MTFIERHRGRPGFLGWLILKWDVRQLRRFVRTAQREPRA